MTSAVLSLSLAYVCLLLLLLLVVFKSEIGVIFKLGLLVVCAGFYFGHYLALQSFLGWPAGERLPEHFQLVHSVTVEPDLKQGEAGGIYLWVRDPEDEAWVPRSYRIEYNRQAHRDIDDAKEKQQQGERLIGRPDYSGSGNAPQISFETVQRNKKFRKSESGAQ